jgi:anti-anti-sigma factor
LAHYEPFNIVFQQEGAVRIARLSGELDLASVDRFREEMAAAVEVARGGTLLVDLRPLTFMDSTGIRLLLELRAESERDGFELSVINGTRTVRRVLQVSGVDGVLPLRDAPEDEVRFSPSS